MISHPDDVVRLIKTAAEAVSAAYKAWQQSHRTSLRHDLLPDHPGDPNDSLYHNPSRANQGNHWLILPNHYFSSRTKLVVVCHGILCFGPTTWQDG
jgi:hypothetical protein